MLDRVNSELRMEIAVTREVSLPVNSTLVDADVGGVDRALSLALVNARGRRKASLAHVLHTEACTTLREAIKRADQTQLKAVSRRRRRRDATAEGGLQNRRGGHPVPIHVPRLADRTRPPQILLSDSDTLGHVVRLAVRPAATRRASIPPRHREQAPDASRNPSPPPAPPSQRLMVSDVLKRAQQVGRFTPPPHTPPATRPAARARRRPDTSPTPRSLLSPDPLRPSTGAAPARVRPRCGGDGA